MTDPRITKALDQLGGYVKDSRDPLWNDVGVLVSVLRDVARVRDGLARMSDPQSRIIGEYLGEALAPLAQLTEDK